MERFPPESRVKAHWYRTLVDASQSNTNPRLNPSPPLNGAEAERHHQAELVGNSLSRHVSCHFLTHLSFGPLSASH